MRMISLKVKTLDGGTHEFSVSDEETIAQFKQRIEDRLEIPISYQRLLFQGRVLNDEATLQSYGVHEKVIHLVTRRIPSADQEARSADTSASDGQSADNDTSTGNLGNAVQSFYQQIDISANPAFRVAVDPSTRGLNFSMDVSNTPRYSMARLRWNYMRRLFNQICAILGPFEDDSIVQSHRNIPEDRDVLYEESPYDILPQSERLVEVSRNALPISALADELDRLQGLFRRMLPVLERWTQQLRDTVNVEGEEYPQDENFTRYDVVHRQASRMLHLLSHLTHISSDFMIQYVRPIEPFPLPTPVATAVPTTEPPTYADITAREPTIEAENVTASTFAAETTTRDESTPLANVPNEGVVPPEVQFSSFSSPITSATTAASDGNVQRVRNLYLIDGVSSLQAQISMQPIGAALIAATATAQSSQAPTASATTASRRAAPRTVFVPIATATSAPYGSRRLNVYRSRATEQTIPPTTATSLTPSTSVAVTTPIPTTEQLPQSQEANAPTTSGVPLSDFQRTMSRSGRATPIVTTRGTSRTSRGGRSGTRGVADFSSVLQDAMGASLSGQQNPYWVDPFLRCASSHFLPRVGSSEVEVLISTTREEGMPPTGYLVAPLPTNFAPARSYGTRQGRSSARVEGSAVSSASAILTSIPTQSARPATSVASNLSSLFSGLVSSVGSIIPQIIEEPLNGLGSTVSGRPNGQTTMTGMPLRNFLEAIGWGSYIMPESSNFLTTIFLTAIGRLTVENVLEVLFRQNYASLDDLRVPIQQQISSQSSINAGIDSFIRAIVSDNIIRDLAHQICCRCNTEFERLPEILQLWMHQNLCQARDLMLITPTNSAFGLVLVDTISNLWFGLLSLIEELCSLAMPGTALENVLEPNQLARLVMSWLTLTFPFIYNLSRSPAVTDILHLLLFGAYNRLDETAKSSLQLRAQAFLSEHSDLLRRRSSFSRLVSDTTVSADEGDPAERALFNVSYEEMCSKAIDGVDYETLPENAIAGPDSLPSQPDDDTQNDTYTTDPSLRCLPAPWRNIVARDVEQFQHNSTLQRTDSAPPQLYSEAYVSGMPAKRRRIMRDQTCQPKAILQEPSQLLSDVLLEALSSSSTDEQTTNLSYEDDLAFVRDVCRDSSITGAFCDYLTEELTRMGDENKNDSVANAANTKGKGDKLGSQHEHAAEEK